MKGLEFGWRQSIEQYHYYELDNTIAICYNTVYSKRGEDSFITEAEFDSTIKLCKVCYALRESLLRNIIVKLYKNAGHWQQSKCPSCNSNVVFWTRDNNNQHNCTVCHNLVEI